MKPLVKLGGFKILKGMARFSLVMPENSDFSPAAFFGAIARKKINLPYVACIRSTQSRGLNIMADETQGLRISLLIEENIGKTFIYSSGNAILSIFPHKNNPEITCRIFEAFDLQGVTPDAFANSPSAISVVLKEECLSQASNALFGPFSFSAYRTPDDWKLAQKGKEHIYKEVIASYQEQRPKVYGVECYDGRELLRERLTRKSMPYIGAAFKEFARSGLDLTFFATGPSQNGDEEILSFCLPASMGEPHSEILERSAPDTYIDSVSPVAVFSMNGPHFGDRYGIVSELLSAFENNNVDLLCLSCTIASVSGVVPSSQLDSSIETIKGCFDVPAVIKK